MDVHSLAKLSKDGYVTGLPHFVLSIVETGLFIQASNVMMQILIQETDVPIYATQNLDLLAKKVFYVKLFAGMD